MALRLIAVGLGALVAAGLTLRSAVVAMPPDRRPILAEQVWPGHPTVLIEQGMTSIGAAAARGGNVPDVARTAMAVIARKAPLAPEPYLVAAAGAQIDGHLADAERLFVAARDRDPRSAAARYFLADRYLRTNRVVAGLTELQALVRLVPSASSAFLPALVSHASAPGAVLQLRRFFRVAPEFEAPVLAHLARDAANAELVLALAQGSTAPRVPDWRIDLVTALVLAGDYAKARHIWSRLAGVSGGTGLYNPGFAKSDVPPPFNWTYPVTAAGLAEPADGGRLQFLYYGRADALLAAQTVLLAPGTYRLGMTVDAVRAPGGVAWTVTCVKAGRPILTLPVNVARGRVEERFVVPEGDCPAQQVELRGYAAGSPPQVEGKIGSLQLARVTP